MINLILKEQVDNFKFITAKFVGSSTAYTYKTQLDLKAGDFIVVDAPSGLTVVTVEDPNVEVVESPKFAIKWVVSKVDVSHYKSCLTLEKAVAQQIRDQQKEDEALLASGKNKTVARL